MLLPIGTDRPLRRPTRITYALVALNVLVFLAQLALHAADPDAFRRAMDLLTLSPARPRPWAFLSYAFLHDHRGFLHVAANMLILWVFGPNVEDRLGRPGFAALYLVAAIAAGALHALVRPEPVVGASGAVAAVTGAYLVLFPRTRVRVLLIFLIIGVFWIPAWWFILFAMVRDFLPLGMGIQDGVAHEAHLAGYACGAGVSLLLLSLGVLAREPYDLLTLGRQAARRRRLREAAFLHARDRVRRARDARSATTIDSPAAQARAELASLIASDQLDRAADAYRQLLQAFPDDPAAVLSRRHLYTLANHLYLAGDHATAAAAYEQLLLHYPDDPERGPILLLLGRISARHLNDPDRARRWLTQALQSLADDAHIRMARAELDALGP